ncbi:MAG: hypothetical protein AAGI49_09650 [Bacteroidota bacterium]
MKYAPYNYLEKTRDGNYSLSTIIFVDEYNRVVFRDIVYQEEKTLLVGQVKHGLSGNGGNIEQLTVLKSSNIVPTNTYVEVVIENTDGSLLFKSIDRYEDADPTLLSPRAGLADNCPHLFISSSGRMIYPKVVFPLKDYEYNVNKNGRMDISISSSWNTSFRCEVKFDRKFGHKELFIPEQLDSATLMNPNGYFDVEISAELMRGYSEGGNNVNINSSSAAGPIKKKKAKKRNII